MKPKYMLARSMRKALTTPEWLLWERLKTRQQGGPIFRRQYAIGPYILDFYCIRAKLAVEVDGSQHSADEATAAHDTVRDAWLNDQGIEVYRLPASTVFADADGAADGAILLAEERLEGR